MSRAATLALIVTACASDQAGRGQLPRDLDVEVASHAVAPDAGLAPVTPPVPSVAPPEPGPPPPPVPEPSPAAVLATIERLAWPATTSSFVLRNSEHVYARPDATSEALGKIIAATRLAVGESVAGDRRCKVWLAVLPEGSICARSVKPSTLAPERVVQPVVASGKLLPQDYFGIRKGAQRFASEDHVRGGTARPEPKHESTYMVTGGRPLDIDGVTYVPTSAGLVASSDLYKHSPSSFAGLDLVATPPPAWPFAWVFARRGVTVRATPEKRGVEVGTLKHRELVPVLEEQAAFARIGEGRWVERGSLRIARKRARPAVEGAHAKWIDVDRDEQLMIAYAGDAPVFATLISSGRRKHDTPPAIYRIRSKSALTKMAAEERESSHYEVSEVPWATRFRSGLYFHAAYWHDQFGSVQSHGCVNLSPRDARWVYDWTEPTMPAGWNELEVQVPGSMVVRVFDATHLDPPVFDYDREVIERTKIRAREKVLKQRREAAEAAAAAGTTTVAPAPK